MKILVRRDQKQVKGWLGGDKGILFSMFVKAELTPDERALIQKYKFHDYLLHAWETRKPGGDADDVRHHRITVEGLIEGREIDADNIADLLMSEQQIVEAAQTLKVYLEAASTFGGERVIDI